MQSELNFHTHTRHRDYACEHIGLRPPKDQPGAEGTMGEQGFYKRSGRSETQADDVGSSSQEDRSVPAGEVGEGEGAAEEGGVTQVLRARGQGVGYPSTSMRQPLSTGTAKD
jgi:hypothetical protein